MGITLEKVGRLCVCRYKKTKKHMMETVAGNSVEVRLTRRLERIERKLIRIEAILYRILGVPRNETRGADQHDEASSGNGEEEESRHV